MRLQGFPRFVAAVLLGMVWVAPGCQSAPKEEPPLLLFPSPPEKPRIQYLTWASGAAQVEPGRSGLEDWLFGDEPELLRTLNKPYGLTAREGVVYVCDTKAISIARLDYVNKTFSMFGTQGPGRLRKPINITIDPLGYKFVVDPQRRQVVVFGPDDEYVTAFNIPEPCRPVDVALWGNEVYVLDNDETCQIVVLDRRTGEVIRTFGGPGGEPGQFKIPNSICIDAEGFLYVSDTHNWRIQKLTRQGEAVWVRGSPGYHIGQFGRPRGIRAGPDGVLYVVDGATEIVQMWNVAGTTLMRFGGPGDVPGALGLPATVAVDATSVPYFKDYIHPDFNAEYLVFVSSQYGKRLVTVYAFGSFPEGYELHSSRIIELPDVLTGETPETEELGEEIDAVRGQVEQEPDPTEQDPEKQDTDGSR